MREDSELRTNVIKFSLIIILAGVICIIISYCIKNHIENNITQYSQNVSSNGQINSFWTFIIDDIATFLNSLGITAIISALISIILEMSNFFEKIQFLLAKIVISKDFLKNISTKEKEEVLKNLLRPTDLQTEQYSGIVNYYAQYSKELLSIAKKNFKTNFIMDVEATIENNIVNIKSKWSYRLYKGIDGFEPIEIAVEQDAVEPELFLTGYNSERKKVDLKKEDFNPENAMKGIRYYHELNDDDNYSNNPYVTVEMNFQENGYDHWTYYFYRAFTPADGLYFKLKTYNGLVIKHHQINDLNNVPYSITDSQNYELIIRSSSWIKSGAGFNVIIGKDE